MKRRHSALIILLFSVIAAFGCNKASSSGNDASAANANQVAAQTANTNDNRASANANVGAQARANESPRLLGTYEISEVHKDGVVTMISEYKSTFTFSPNGTYVRKSRKGKDPYHVDAGKFRIEGSDRLVLRIEMAQGKGVLKEPRLVSHKIKVTPDGEELRMTSADGKIAVFRRVKDQ